MAVLDEFRLPWTGHRSCPGLVELSCLWIQAGRGHTNKIAPERHAALVQHGWIFSLNSSYIFLFIDTAWSCIWVELPSLFTGRAFGGVAGSWWDGEHLVVLGKFPWALCPGQVRPRSTHPFPGTDWSEQQLPATGWMLCWGISRNAEKCWLIAYSLSGLRGGFQILGWSQQKMLL